MWTVRGRKLATASSPHFSPLLFSSMEFYNVCTSSILKDISCHLNSVPTTFFTQFNSPVSLFLLRLLRLKLKRRGSCEWWNRDTKYIHIWSCREKDVAALQNRACSIFVDKDILSNEEYTTWALKKCHYILSNFDPLLVKNLMCCFPAGHLLTLYTHTQHNDAFCLVGKRVWSLQNENIQGWQVKTLPCPACILH